MVEMVRTRAVRLEDIASVNPRLSQKIDPSTLVSFVGMADLSADRAVTEAADARPYGDVAKGYTAFQDGDLLVAKITPCFENGKIGQARLSHRLGFGSTEFHVVRPRPELADARFLLHFLRSPRFRAAGEMRMTGSGGQRRVPVDYINQAQLYLPSLDEQRRIAAILDKADELRTKRRQALIHLDALSSAAFQVLLARENWPKRPFGELCSRVTVGVVVKPASHYVSDGIPALRSLNVRSGGLVMENLVHFSETSHNGPLRKSQLRPGDIVTVRTGNAGTSAVVPANAGPMNAIDLIIATPTPGLLSPEYAVAFMNSDDGRRMVLGESRGQIQQHFNVKSLQKSHIPVPPIHVQHELASRLAQIDHLRRVQQSQLTEFDALFASLQHRAFNGEL